MLITYSYLVTNDGNVTLTAVTVTDPMPNLSAISCPDASLAPNASETCTATYTTTQADVDIGSITNTGTAAGQPPTGSPVTASSTLTIPASQTPAITVKKSASPTSFSQPGTVITYSYLVTNTGNVTLTNVAVADALPGLSPINCHGVTTLAPLASQTCTATHITTQADVDHGGITNTATVTGDPPIGSPVNDSSNVTTPAVQTPNIEIAKTASISSFSGPGIEVTYHYQVTNTGNVTLDPVTVTDPMPGLSALSCAFTLLPPGGSGACTATYTTTQANVDAGGLMNTGTATGTPPIGSNVTATSTVTIPASQHAAIALTKTASLPNFASAGTLITYSYAVTNSGNVTLTSVGITDNRLGTISCPGTTLVPSQTETCTATYTTTQADVDAGGIVNTGTATGEPPSGQAVTSEDSVTIPAVVDPGITVEKTANVDDFSQVGTVIGYSYLVTNAGNVTLTDIGVTDNKIGTVTCPESSLAPNVSETCTGSYTTTQADLDDGQITNTGTATGQPPTGAPVLDDDTITVPAVQTPEIGVDKTPSPTTFNAPGTLITYSFLITNTGNVTLRDIQLSDPMTGLTGPTCPGVTPDTAVAPGDSVTCTATYTTTQADVDGTGITNTATASGTSPQDVTVTGSDSALVTPVENPSISMTKTASVDSFSAAGTLITYSYEVKNTGNVTLHSLMVTDAMAGLSAITLSDHPSRAARHGYLYRHLHHHAGRRRQGQHHQHGNGHRHQSRRRNRLRQFGSNGARRAEPEHRPCEVGQRDVVLGAGHQHHLQLQGDQHRQRDAALDRRG